MKLFRKNITVENKSSSVDAGLPSTSVNLKSSRQEKEEILRQWIAGRFETDTPEEILCEFRQMVQSEMKKQKAEETILDSSELKRIQDSLRLRRTKLTNITQALNGLESQKAWWHKFKELNGLLEKYKQAFFESNKQLNAHLQDVRDLERFETFEEVLGNYHRIKAKENIIRLIREDSSQHALDLSEALAGSKEAQKQKDIENKKYQEAWQILQQKQSALSEGYRLKSAIGLYETEMEELNERKGQVESQIEYIRNQELEVAEEFKKVQEKMTAQQQQQQSLESQKRMLVRGEDIQTRLGFLLSLKTRGEQLTTMLERAQKKQHEQDERMNKLFLALQDINAQINALQGELQIHQKSIIGTDSYKLQQRAMDLKSKKEMLTSALLLWKEISERFALVDEKSQEIMRMKHHNDALKIQIAKLEPETIGLQKQYEELKYAYTLTKSQDVMQLRKDLQEGVNCSVCGAIHHPYHSDTLLEQSKLIGEIKRDFDQAATELKHKQTLLEELKREQALEEGRIEVGYQALEIYKNVLQGNVNHWETFVVLDRSFKDCSSSTNFEGRRIMLQQLLERTGVDAEEAKKELDTLNYHQSCINDLNKLLAQKETEKKDLSVRLNEVNTGCQVMAYQTEQLQQALSRNNGRYSELFEEIDQMMTISNWYKVWSENPETLRIHIEQQMHRWFDLQRERTETRLEVVRLQGVQECIGRQIKLLNQLKTFISGKMERIFDDCERSRASLQKLFPDSNVEVTHTTIFHNMEEQEKAREKTNRQAEESLLSYARHLGYSQRMEDTILHIETRIAEERSELDIWIRKYNAQHSPVQFSELEHVFSSPVDWNALRHEVRTLELNNMVAEARVDEARMVLAAHQVNALSQIQDKEDKTAVLNTEIARLESEQQAILAQIAGLQAQLDAHELGLQKQAVGQENGEMTT